MQKEIFTASVSKLEAFRKYLHASEDETWLNEESLLETLKGIRPTNDKARYGTAFHAIIEDPKANYFSNETNYGIETAEDNLAPPPEDESYYLIDGIKFKQEQYIHALQYAAEHPLMQNEVPVYKVYKTKHFDIIVTMRVDALEGINVRDVKTKYSTPDMQEYIDSCQWKFYLDALGLDIFYYDVFQVGRYETVADAYKAVIKPLEPMKLVRYPNMLTDIQSLLESFSEFIVSKGLIDLIRVIPESHVEIELERLALLED